MDGTPTPKVYAEASVFTAANLLREARRQKGLPETGVPAVCLLDPDGDIVDALAVDGRGRRDNHWACYHTDLWLATLGGEEVGVVGRAVGAPFAVLVAEELFAAGCELLVSVTSAGRIGGHGGAAMFVLIDRALRDEGTSDHYAPPARWARLDPRLGERLTGAFDALDVVVTHGASWTTDAPFRETPTAVAAAEAAGVVAVEMEAAALYAFAATSDRPVVCLGHLTNTMAVSGDDFDKGADAGVAASLAVVAAVFGRLRGPDR